VAVNSQHHLGLSLRKSRGALCTTDLPDIPIQPNLHNKARKALQLRSLPREIFQIPSPQPLTTRMLQLLQRRLAEIRRVRFN
jgi:hypothetical protein